MHCIFSLEKDVTAASVSDTDLGTELARVTVTQKSRSGQSSTLRAYFSAGTATGTLREFAWFGGGVDGDAGAGSGSGTMYNRIIINKTVTATQSITIEQAWTL